MGSDLSTLGAEEVAGEVAAMGKTYKAYKQVVIDNGIDGEKALELDDDTLADLQVKPAQRKIILKKIAAAAAEPPPQAGRARVAAATPRSRSKTPAPRRSPATEVRANPGLDMRSNTVMVAVAVLVFAGYQISQNSGSQTTPKPPFDFCAALSGDSLPSFCKCSNSRGGMTLNCGITIPFVDTAITAVTNINPCGWGGATVDLQVTCDYPKMAYKLGPYKTGFKQDNIPVKGLHVKKTGLGTIGVVMGVDFEGTLGNLDLKVSLDACGKVMGYAKCGADLTRKLPFKVINFSKKIDFSTACN
jgi:hypothetical protein